MNEMTIYAVGALAQRALCTMVANGGGHLDVGGPASSTRSREDESATSRSGMSHRPTDLPAGLHIGDVIAGKYRIDGILGAGAMGTVVAAYHLLLAERVAIKFLHSSSVGNPEATARFIREAQAAIRIKSEHVARVLDIAQLESGDLCIVMEFLEGSDLAAWLRDHGAMSARDAVDWLLQACEAIAEAHALGIVHRDLKPANLFLVRPTVGSRDILKVLDFGISKTIKLAAGTLDSEDPAGGAVTGASAIMGSPFYMSPEQMGSARDVDGRSDIWALGVILCELVTGRLPFTGRTLLEVYQKIVTTSAPFPLPDELPAGLRAVIGRCVHRRAEDRYASIHELAVALAPFGSARALASVESIAQVSGSAMHGGDEAAVKGPTSASAPEALAPVVVAAPGATLLSQTPGPPSAGRSTPEPTSGSVAAARPAETPHAASSHSRRARRVIMLAGATAVVVVSLAVGRTAIERRGAAGPVSSASSARLAPSAATAGGRPVASEELSVGVAMPGGALTVWAEGGAAGLESALGSGSPSARPAGKGAGSAASGSRTSTPKPPQPPGSGQPGLAPPAPAPSTTPAPQAMSTPPPAPAASDELLELLKHRE
jgi:eukaryotic-like serine/threonine-protein kinase